MNPLIAAFKKGIEQSGVKPARISMPSDIFFEPGVVKDLGVDYFHVTRGRSIAFGTGLKLANPGLRVTAVAGDLVTIGGNHFVHGSRRNMEILVIYVNNFVYRTIAGKTTPQTTVKFSPYSTFEEPFNIPHLGNSCGAIYTARWTALHTKELADSIAHGLTKRGLAVIEVLVPGPDYYHGISTWHEDVVQFYYENSEIRNNELPRSVGITPDSKIIVGTFTDKAMPPFIDNYNKQLTTVLKDKFTPYGITAGGYNG
ncbi:2-oxoacid:ferredoxin oxidoreductase subunit beta [candidate division WOR-3 bacterium]|nr:2-oxoacid:ferredoxin oxidoreductase subunit beta [candidate division WOR-3 bacterium]